MPQRAFLLALAAAVLLAGQAGTVLAQSTLRFYNWSNYFPPDLLEAFTAETGISVTTEYYSDNETLLASLQSGASYDLVVPSDYMVKTLIEQGLLQQIDTPSLPNFTLVGAPHDDPAYDPGRRFSAPYMWGTTGFTYDSAKVSGGKLEESWNEVFHPRKGLEGKVAVLDDSVSLYNAAAHYLGFDQCTEDAKKARQIFDLLMGQKPKVTFTAPEGTIDRMVKGRIVLQQQWNGAAHRVRRQLSTATYVYPKEGLDFWSESFAVPASASNPEGAKTFINWIMAPENIARASNYTGYMNAVQGSEAFMDDTLRGDPAVNMPESYLDRLRPAKDCDPAALALRDKVWARLSQY